MTSPKVRFSEIQDFKRRLRKQDLWVPNRERCGVINKRGRVLEKENRAANPSEDFKFQMKDLEGAIATWHTHPSGSANLSIADYWFFKSWTTLVHFIIFGNDIRCYMEHEGIIYLVDEEKDYPPWTT